MFLVKGKITITGEGDDTAARQADKRNKEVVFKNYAPFSDCISEINNTQVDNAKDLNVVMLLYNLLEYSDYYSKTSWSLWQYYRDEPALDNAGNIVNFPGNSFLFKFKIGVTWETPNVGSTKAVEIAVPLKYFRNFRKTLVMPLIKLISF